MTLSEEQSDFLSILFSFLKNPPNFRRSFLTGIEDPRENVFITIFSNLPEC